MRSASVVAGQVHEVLVSTSTSGPNRSRVQNVATSTARRWAGRVLTAIPVLFLVFDSVIKLLVIQPVSDSFARLGYSTDVAVGIGIIELACVLVYLIPRTSIAGAVLLTGFLGGAIATHVRVGDPLFSHVLFPTYVAAMLWGGLLLRDRRVRALLQPTTQNQN